MAAALEHGHTRYGGVKKMSPTYHTWVNMKRRCVKEDFDSYPDYGGRGITYDERWEDFAAFLSDMGERPEGTTLDRIDPDGNYTKENCRWATAREQLLNRRNTVMVTFKGKTVPLRDACLETGVPYATAWRRLKSGWDHTLALTTPPDQRRVRKDKR